MWATACFFYLDLKKAPESGQDRAAFLRGKLKNTKHLADVNAA
jgi:hypothetical protein